MTSGVGDPITAREAIILTTLGHSVMAGEPDSLTVHTRDTFQRLAYREVEALGPFTIACDHAIFALEMVRRFA